MEDISEKALLEHVWHGLWSSEASPISIYGILNSLIPGWISFRDFPLSCSVFHLGLSGFRHGDHEEEEDNREI